MLPITFFFFLGCSTGDKECLMRRGRLFSSFQVAELEKTFLEMNYVSSVETEELAERLNMSHKQVVLWFQTKRVRSKNQYPVGEMRSSKSPNGWFILNWVTSSFYNYIPMPSTSLHINDFSPVFLSKFYEFYIWVIFFHFILIVISPNYMDE